MVGATLACFVVLGHSRSLYTLNKSSRLIEQEKAAAIASNSRQFKAR